MEVVFLEYDGSTGADTAGTTARDVDNLNAIISSGKEIGELQKDKLVERRVRCLLGLVIYEDVWCRVGRKLVISFNY